MATCGTQPKEFHVSPKSLSKRRVKEAHTKNLSAISKAIFLLRCGRSVPCRSSILAWKLSYRCRVAFQEICLTSLSTYINVGLQWRRSFIEDRAIKSDAELKGVREASEWFFEDAKAKGPDGADVQQCIKRLATLFRNVRFSDKPSECSLCTFSACLDSVSTLAKRNIDLAEQYSLLIKISKGQRDRNSGGVNFKYQINPMLAPLWDLPISRRGAMALTDVEINAIFDPQSANAFDKVMGKRIARMTAPAFGKRLNAKSESEPDLFP